MFLYKHLRRKYNSKYLSRIPSSLRGKSTTFIVLEKNIKTKNKNYCRTLTNLKIQQWTQFLKKLFKKIYDNMDINSPWNNIFEKSLINVVLEYIILIIIYNIKICILKAYAFCSLRKKYFLILKKSLIYCKIIFLLF